LAAESIMPLERAWALVSENPARALGHGDRGVLTDGRRADLILVDASTPALPRVVATLVNGRIRFLTEAERIGDARRT
jgi:alpha-D-ribose 1-methylphosphonate 5-triphosphate diphosphatase